MPILGPLRSSPPLAALTLLLLCLNAALIVQNRELKTKRQVAAPVLPVPGTKISKLDGFGPDGTRVSVLFPVGGPKTVLLVFSTACHYCDLNWDAWNGIVNSLDHRSYRVVYVNTRSSLTAAYLKEHRVSGGTVFAEVDPRSVVALNLGVTPVTVLLGSDGVVEEAWAGLLEGDDLASVRATLGR